MLGFLKRFFKRDEKFAWIYSGVAQGANNAVADAGFIRADHIMTRSEALRYLREIVPRGTVIHVDDINHIITYKLL